ncbi:MAG: hypothetical protein Q8Q39_00310 [bacterium]|nr:hypothetical protein [bacterium]
MLLIRETLIAKPGMASKLAKLMQEMFEESDDTARVMTDLTGQFNQVVIETEYEGLEEFGSRMEEYRSNVDMGKKMRDMGYTDMYQTGSREIYQIW